MNLRIVGFGGLLGIIVILFSQLLVISWTGEVIFNEPNTGILISEIFLTVLFMIFVSFLLVEELKKEKMTSVSK